MLLQLKILIVTVFVAPLWCCAMVIALGIGAIEGMCQKYKEGVDSLGIILEAHPWLRGVC